MRTDVLPRIRFQDVWHLTAALMLAHAGSLQDLSRATLSPPCPVVLGKGFILESGIQWQAAESLGFQHKGRTNAVKVVAPVEVQVLNPSPSRA